MIRWRWALVALVLMAAGTVALWPRDGDVGVAAPSAVGRNSGPSLAKARTKAALRPCPQAIPGAPGSAPLAGVRVNCLGDGAPVDLGAALATRPALINVWASWCQPCRDELPVLDVYAAAPDAVPVLGVQVRSEPGDGLDLLTGLGVRFPSVHDADGAVDRALRLPKYLPVSYVVRPDGTVHQVDPPTPFTSAEQIRQTVRRYLTEEQSGRGN